MQANLSYFLQRTSAVSSFRVNLPSNTLLNLSSLKLFFNAGCSGTAMTRQGTRFAAPRAKTERHEVDYLRTSLQETLED